MRIEHYKKKKPLNKSLQDFLLTTIDFDCDKKKVISFCVSQVWFSNGMFYEIIKYDTAHGRFHVHRNGKGNISTEFPFNKSISLETYNECKRDIEENWQKYKRLFIEKKPGETKVY